MKTQENSFPIRVFLVIIICVCVWLAASSVIGFMMLSRMRDKHLENLGHEILQANMLYGKNRVKFDLKNIEKEGLNYYPLVNLSIFQEALEETYNEYKEKVIFLLISDDSGEALASAGKDIPKSNSLKPGITNIGGATFYLFESKIRPPPFVAKGIMRNPFDEALYFRAGINPSYADLIMNHAYLHVLTQGIAIIILLVLSFYLRRVLRRFLKLKVREESERSLTTLGRMAATLAHEIRNPLGAMKGLTQVVQEEIPEDHHTQKLMQTVVNESIRLELLVNNLLEFSKPKKFEINTFDLNELIVDVRSMLFEKLNKTGVGIEIVTGNGAFMINSNQDGLRQVLLNVMINAIESSSLDKIVEVAAKLDKKTKEAIIEVKDNGSGLSNQNVNDLFEPFVTNKIKGTGLGLPISRQIIDQLKGKIALSNRPEGGVQCFIRIPTNSI